MCSARRHWQTKLYGLKLSAPEDVYKPSDDTFLLADNLTLRQGDDVLEVGCGCGLIAMLAAEKAGRVVATDINPLAVEGSRTNAEQNGLADKVEFRVGDLFEPIEIGERFDLIVFNPPYLPVGVERDEWLERAWSGGADGRKIVDSFIDEAANFLKEHGRILFVQSTLSDVEKTIQRMVEKGFSVRILAEKLFDFEVLMCVEASC